MSSKIYHFKTTTAKNLSRFATVQFISFSLFSINNSNFKITQNDLK